MSKPWGRSLKFMRPSQTSWTLDLLLHHHKLIALHMYDYFLIRKVNRVIFDFISWLTIYSLYFQVSNIHDYWHNKQQSQLVHSDWWKITLDGIPIGSGTLARDLGVITIWNPRSNGNWWYLEGRFWYINLPLTSEYLEENL